MGGKPPGWRPGPHDGRASLVDAMGVEQPRRLGGIWHEVVVVADQGARNKRTPNVVKKTIPQNETRYAKALPFLNLMIREDFEAAGLSIENPSGAPFIDPTMLCDRDGGKI